MADELPLNWKEPNLPEYDGTTDPQEHLSCFENIALLHYYTAGVKCRMFVNLHTVGPIMVQSIAFGIHPSIQRISFSLSPLFASSK
ncbi:UNVERIFIED_CONTAM: hypothetical protein Slati_1281900 [Sesamum latifolium]|uniref:Uncharacterized protein n=1 Tax=Sesamum latifolium TaxID=2727402 RepID=A0AAW2XGX5_9LAMI